MKIVDVRVTDLQFSRAPDTLKKHLCTPTSKFRDDPDGYANWFGPVALSLVEVLTDEGISGFGSIGGFTAAGSEVIGTYLKPLVVGGSPFETERLWDKMYRSTVRFGRKGATVPTTNSPGRRINPGIMSRAGVQKRPISTPFGR